MDNANKEGAKRHWKEHDGVAIAASLLGVSDSPDIPTEDAKEVAEVLAKSLLSLNQHASMLTAEVQGVRMVAEIARALNSGNAGAMRKVLGIRDSGVVAARGFKGFQK